MLNCRFLLIIFQSVVLTILSASGVSAQPQHKGYNPSAPIKAWRIEQSMPFGKYTAYISDNAIKIEGVKGGRLVSNAPDWDVTVYNTIDKTITKLSLDQWFRNMELKQVPLAKIRQKPKPCTILGLPANTYAFPINQAGSQDQGFSVLYRSQTQKSMVKWRKLSVLADISKLPRQAVEILRIHAEIPFIGSLPLQCYDEHESGSKVDTIKTYSQKYTTVRSNFFTERPVGYKKTRGTVAMVFYGQECEDVGKMMLGGP